MPALPSSRAALCPITARALSPLFFSQVCSAASAVVCPPHGAAVCLLSVWRGVSLSAACVSLCACWCCAVLCAPLSLSRSRALIHTAKRALRIGTRQGRSAHCRMAATATLRVGAVVNRDDGVRIGTPPFVHSRAFLSHARALAPTRARSLACALAPSHPLAVLN